ncbi:hypothetical protein MGSAQ_001352 [marine sediment metagenome]|uniref:Uncharacterized protein n=1 Tax=marine sediment metagenome TaxID=412755 RepID=A0A1B6NW00_9ZZZZ
MCSLFIVNINKSTSGNLNRCQCETYSKRRLDDLDKTELIGLEVFTPV